MDEWSLKNQPICPISGQIFRNPVVAADGHIYEKSVIVDWFKQSHKSPITNQVIEPILYQIYWFKDYVDNWLKHNPEYKTEQFMDEFKASVFYSLAFKDSPLNSVQLAELRDYLRPYPSSELILNITNESKFIQFIKETPHVLILCEHDFTINIPNNQGTTIHHLIFTFAPIFAIGTWIDT
jgi:hypothetical protein